MLASSGLRVGELLKAEIDKTNRMIIPNHNSQTKISWVSFYSEEAAALLENGFGLKLVKADMLLYLTIIEI